MRFWLSLFILVLPGLCPEGPWMLSAQEPETLSYQVSWSGLKKHPMRDAVQEASRIVRLKAYPPSSFPLLRKRMEDDLRQIKNLLQANGYYTAEVQGEIDRNTAPMTVRFVCNPGPLFTIGEQRVSYPPSRPPVKKWTPYLNRNDPATTRVIETAELRMLRFFQDHGHPFPEITSQEYLLDPEKKTMDLSYTVDPGPEKRMGRVRVEGLKSVQEKSILRQVNWNQGDLYDLRLLEDFEKDLILTGLFSRVRLTPEPSEDNAEVIHFVMSVTERYPRTVRFGVDYRSDVGFGAKTSWEHRNIFGKGERFKVDLTLAEEESFVNAGIRKPGFQIRNQSLVLGLKAGEERPEAYTSLSFESYIGLEREYSRKFSSSLGLGYKYANVKQAGDENTFGLLSLPLLTVWDSTNDELHPLRGHRFITQLTPYTDILNQDLVFGRVQATGARYHLLRKRPQMVLAGRATAGTLIGAASGDIPADERFYSGGGGSVRGYTYQSISPRREGEVIGGRSLLELSLELRTRLGETWGFATFIDGGTVTTEEDPFLDFPMQWGAGAGLRIFTGIGPLRLDLAYPLNPNENQESQLQFYISLGQSF